MRIGIIGDAIDEQYAGIHYYTKNIISHLLAEDSKNEYFIFRHKKTEVPANAREIVVPHLKWVPGFKAIRLFLLYPYYASKLNLDVMVEPAHFGPFNLPARIKRVTVIHDLSPILYPQWHTFNGAFLQKLFLPGIIRRSDKIITNSNFTKSDIVRLTKKEENDIEAIHLGVSDDFTPKTDPLILGHYGLYLPYILFLGTLEPRKNLVNLIKAYEVLRDQNSSQRYQLILVGKKGWKVKSVLKAKYESRYHRDIIILGYVERKHLPYLISSCSLFVYPSLYEGFGLPIIEAMACGARVVASDMSSMPEVGKHFAEYFDPSSPDDIASVMSKVLKSSDSNREQRIQYAQTFRWQRTARKFIEALKPLF